MSKRMRRARRPKPTPRRSRSNRARRSRTHHTVPRGRPAVPVAPASQSVADRLARLLESPHLQRIVPHLAPETLHRLIRRCGLEACGELVASASPQQLTALLDLDLWRSGQPGRDDRFDVDRFGEWLEVLVETGAASAARTLAALDPDLVIAGLCRYIRVFDVATVSTMASDDEGSEVFSPIVDSSVRCEIGGYVICTRRSDAWDAIMTVLHELHADHPAHFHTVVGGCRQVSNSAPEIDGLDELLTAPEQLLHDVAVDRENRRSHQGYLPAGDARAFLQLARQRSVDPVQSVGTRAIASAYFRAGDEVPPADGSRQRQADDTPSSTDADVAGSIEDVFELLAEAGVLPEKPALLLEGSRPEPSSLTLIKPLMEYVRDADDGAFFARNRELALLANALVSGSSVQSRSFTPEEASDAAVRICNLGLERSAERGALPVAFLVDHDLLSAFEEGWALLHEEVTMFVADRLVALLGCLECSDIDIQRELDVLRRQLARHRGAGTPWHALGELEVVAMLDPVAWAALRGLLGECPVVPAAVRATLDRQTRAVSATAYTFIESRSQIDEVRAFMDRLLEILTG